MSFWKLAYENPFKTIIFGSIAGGVLEGTVRAIASPFVPVFVLADDCAGSKRKAPKKKNTKKKTSKRK